MNIFKQEIVGEALVNEIRSEDNGNIWWLVNNRGNRDLSKPAGTVDNHGYVVISFSYEGKKYKFLAHHIIWRLATGAWPKNQLDHINRNRADNRIENLREVTNQQNHLNRAVNNNNSLGYQNINITRSGSYLVCVRYQGKHVTQRTFRSLAEAIAHRDAIRSEFGFAPATDRATATAAE